MELFNLSLGNLVLITIDFSWLETLISILQFNSEEDNIRLYPISDHTLQQVETWGEGSQVTKPPKSVII